MDDILRLTQGLDMSNRLKILKEELPSYYFRGFAYNLSVYYLIPVILGVGLTRAIMGSWYDIMWSPLFALSSGVVLQVISEYDL